MSNPVTDWHSHCDDDGILWLTLDLQDADTNVLSVSVLEQLDSLIDQINN